MTQCENKHNNLKNCNCSYPCGNKGICCDCLRNHRKNGELPACYFPDDAEQTYNRSVEYFIEIVQNQGTSFLK